MKVLELCTSPDSGGLELYMARACVALAAAGEPLLAVVGPNSRIAERLRQDGVEMTMLGFRFGPLPLLAARRLARLIDARKIDVVHVHWGKDLPLVALAKRFARRSPRLVYTRHMQITRAKTDMYHRWLYRQVDVLLTITKAMTAKVRQCLDREMSARVHTLYHGVPNVTSVITDRERYELRSAWAVPDEVVLVGVFSRIERPKGQHLLIEALRRARDEEVPLHALIVGHVMDPQYLEQLKATSAEHDLEGRIHFAGFSDDVQRWMQACDIVALTTWEETFGLVLIEAMRAGVAVMGSDRGGVPEIIRHEYNGLLFKSFDAGDFYVQLRRLVVDHRLRAGLAAAGKQDADRRFNDEVHFRTLRAYLRGRSAPSVTEADQGRVDEA